MDVIKGFHDLIHVECIVRNGNNVSADVIDEIETIRTMPVFETESNIWQFGLDDIAGKQQHQYVVHTNKVYLQPLLRDQKRSKKNSTFLPVSNFRTNRFYICRQFRYIVYLISAAKWYHVVTKYPWY